MMKPNCGNIILFIIAKYLLFVLAYGLFISDVTMAECAVNLDGMIFTLLFVVPYLLVNLLLFGYPLFRSFKVSLPYKIWIRFMILFVEFVMCCAFAYVSTSLLNTLVSVVTFLLIFSIKWKSGKPGIAMQEEEDEDDVTWNLLCGCDYF